MTPSTGESRQPTKVTSREMSGLSGTDFARFRSVRSLGGLGLRGCALTQGPKGSR